MNDEKIPVNTFLVLYTCSRLLLPVTAREAVRIYEVVNCPEDVISPDMFDLNITMRVNSEGETLMSGSATMKRMETLDHGTINIKKCQSIETPEEACEQLTMLAIQDVCEYITREGELWSTILLALKPPLVCPLEGSYYFKDVTFDVKRFKQYAQIIGNSILRMEVRAYDGTEVKACLSFAMAIQTVINRGKKNKNKRKPN